MGVSHTFIGMMRDLVFYRGGRWAAGQELVYMSLCSRATALFGLLHYLEDMSLQKGAGGGLVSSRAERGADKVSTKRKQYLRVTT